MTHSKKLFFNTGLMLLVWILSYQNCFATNTAISNLSLSQYFDKSIISEIEIVGNRLLNKEEIVEQIVSRPGSSFNKESILRDLQNIYKLGYFASDGVEAIPFLKDDKTILLQYKITENPPVNDVIFYGNNSIEEFNAYDIFADLIAKPENAKLIKDKIQELETEYLKNGYIIAKVSDIDLDSAGVLKIYVDEGIINKITYKGNEKTQESFLKHLVKEQDINQPYNEFNFAKDFRRLQGSNYFSSVTRTVIPSSESGYELVIELVEKRTASVGVGGGVNSTAGIFGNASVNLGNLRGRGETLNITAILGSGLGAAQTLNNDSRLVRRDNLTQISANYNIPYFRDSEYALNNYVTFSRGPNFNVDLARQSAATVGAGFSRVVGENHVFRLSSDANYIDLEDRDRKEFITEVTRNIVQIDNLSQREVLKKGGSNFTGGRRGIARKEARLIRDEQISSGFYLGLAPRYSYTKLDDRSNPRDGWRTRFNAEPNWGFNEINSFTKADGSATKYLPIGEESSFLLNFRGGSEIFGDVPQFDIYRLGTPAGVRGYRQFTELGVGSRFAITTAEFRTPIYNVISPLKKYKLSKRVDFALFADAGLIGGRVRLNRVTQRLSQAAGVGFGVRVKLPLVGALRLDIGFPLIEILTGNKALFRFNFGPADIF